MDENLIQGFAWHSFISMTYLVDKYIMTILIKYKLHLKKYLVIIRKRVVIGEWSLLICGGMYFESNF